MRRASFAWLSLLSVASCAAGQRLVAPNGDYDDYRQVRLAETRGARLQAAAKYLKERPSGAFADELRALWDGEEPDYFERAKASRYGTLDYLVHLPNGPHAAAAQSLLVAWDTKLEEGEMAALLREARHTEVNLEGAALQRQRVGDTIFQALRVMGDKAAYGVPLLEGPAALRHFLSGGEGPTWGAMPRSTDRDMFFLVPTRLERESRVASLRLAMEVDGSGLVRAGRVSGGDLFVHWLEADAMLALDPTVDEHRARARRYAKERLEGFFEATFPKARCEPPDAGSGRSDARERQSVPEIPLLNRACDGLVLGVVAGRAAGDEDAITVKEGS